ncbi:ATP-binding protein [Desulfovibrio psychrotolerans]|uniref:4Fe-4S ferredoxin-type domain-containing protein n=1 Tax=Desulfovibrio psychrotolerans TaxID=415242 RepID=A0A7J0BTZ6_9BACT|nr:4Fe-4S binding protein [Desulfovibrio psychrotolerans]GFM37138.1 hypothetical protein DSM19430T_18220 [Desulfovibrio psychrotolerans]
MPLFERVLERIADPATVQFYREFRKREHYSFAEFLHGYFYLRFPYFYIGVGKGHHPLARYLSDPLCWLAERLGLWKPGAFARPKGTGGFADTYHGKTLRTESTRKLIRVNREIALPDLEKVLPYSMAKDIILRNPDHIAVFDCPCRVNSDNPCLPLDVCLIVGEPFVSFLELHHANNARRVSPEEAVGIVEASNRRGHVSHAFFKEAMLGRYYAICNCCACCCGAMKAHFSGVPMLEASGYLAVVDADACVGCGKCAKKCQFSAISLQDGLAVVDAEACMGCGVCRFQCAKDAIGLVRNDAASEPLEIDELVARRAA